MDQIFIRGLRLSAAVGLLDWEKKTKQPVVIDCVISVASVAVAAKSEELSSSVDYAVVYEGIIQFVEEQRYLLLETYVEQLVAFIFSLAPQAEAIELSMAKTTIFTQAEQAGVTIRRQRMDDE